MKTLIPIKFDYLVDNIIYHYFLSITHMNSSRKQCFFNVEITNLYCLDLGQS